MGWFKDEETSTFSSTSNVLEKVPDILGTTVPTAVLGNQDISRSLIREFNRALPSKIKDAYNYGREKYHYGLPDGYMTTVSNNDAGVQAVIEAELGEPITLVSNEYGPCNLTALVAEHLHSQGWDRISNEVKNPPYHSAVPVYFIGVHKVANSINELYVTYHTDPNTPLDPYGDLSQINQKVNVGNYYTGEDYYHVVYTVTRTKPKTNPNHPDETYQEYHFWNYWVASNTYPELAPSTDTVLGSPFMPIVPLRVNKQNMARDSVKNTDLYRTSRVLTSKYGLSFDSLCESLNSNPQIQEQKAGNDDDDRTGVDQVNLMMGFNLYTKSSVAKDHMCRFFEQLKEDSTYQYSDFQAWASVRKQDRSDPNHNTLTWKDGSFEMQLRYYYIKVEDLAGDYKQLGLDQMKATARDYVSHTYQEALDIGYGTVYIDVPVWAYDDSDIVFYRQLDTGTYRKVVVKGLRHYSKLYDGQMDRLHIRDGIDGSKGSAFIIPMHYLLSVESGYTQAEQMELYADGLKLVFNSYYTQELDWYETEAFQVVVAIVAAATFVVGGAALIAAVGTAYTSGAVVAGIAISAGWLAVAAVVLEFAVVSYLAGLLFKEFAEWAIEQWGPEAAMIVMVVAYIATQILSFAGPLKGTPWADQLLAVSSNIVPAYQEALGDFAQLELDAHNTRMEEANNKLDELQEQQDELYEGLLPNLDRLYRTQPMFVPNETPDEFYARTIHSGNIGIVGIGAVSRYVDTMLTLPRTQFEA